jgi:large subunit ribosomal protein L21
MDDFAVIQTGGKQFIVKKGDTINIELIKDTKVSDKIKFKEVLLCSKKGKVEIGTPHIDKASVEGTIQKEIKGTKIKILKFKAKSRYRKHIGYRPKYLQVRIDKI